MKTKLTFSQSDIQDGDVICFQVKLSDKEIHDLEIEGLYSNPVQFYDFLQNRVMIVFRPKSDSDPEAPEFNLILSKKQTYNTMAAKVAEYLRHDPIKLRFITTHASNASPKAILKRSLNQSIAEIISPSYTSPSKTVILYEKLNVSIVELEMKRGLEVMAAVSSQKELPPADNRTTSLPPPAAAAPMRREATAPWKDTSGFDIELDRTAQHEGATGARVIPPAQQSPTTRESGLPPINIGAKPDLSMETTPQPEYLRILQEKFSAHRIHVGPSDTDNENNSSGNGNYEEESFSDGETYNASGSGKTASYRPLSDGMLQISG